MFFFVKCLYESITVSCVHLVHICLAPAFQVVGAGKNVTPPYVICHLIRQCSEWGRWVCGACSVSVIHLINIVRCARCYQWTARWLGRQSTTACWLPGTASPARVSPNPSAKRPPRRWSAPKRSTWTVSRTFQLALPQIIVESGAMLASNYWK